VGAVKGVMLSLNPDVTFVDISHEIPPQDIFTGAFTLSRTYSYFPLGTIHYAIVDPGVGMARKALAATAAGHYFVAPDNGILTYIMEANEDFVAYEITADHYFRKPVSATFHGRDVFAPVAAWISRRVELHQVGPVLPSPVRLQIPPLKRVQDALIQGTILAVDRFGNLITNLKPEDISMPFRMLAGQREITALRKTYGEGMPGEVIIVPGSAGYLEIAVKGGSAAATLNMQAGAPIGVILQ
jgi:S-adenosyl-L-methionine hydrolase (adenosine-forming)